MKGYLWQQLPNVKFNWNAAFD